MGESFTEDRRTEHIIARSPLPMPDAIQALKPWQVIADSSEGPERSQPASGFLLELPFEGTPPNLFQRLDRKSERRQGVANHLLFANNDSCCPGGREIFQRRCLDVRDGRLVDFLAVHANLFGR